MAGVLVTVLLALLGFSLSRWWTERDAKNKEIAALDAKNERFKNALGLVSDDWKQITSPDALIRSMHWLPKSMRGIPSRARDKRVASEMALVSGQLGSIERWLNGLILVLVTALVTALP